METSGAGRSSWLVAASFLVLVLVLVSGCMNTGVEGAPEILCLANEECGIGLLCSDGECVGCGDGTPCPFGTYCSFGASDVLSSCLRSRGNGDSCSSYEQCISWYCENSTRTCQECRSNEECHTGMCEAGFCNECIPGTSRGCDSNQFCTTGTGTPRCRTLLPLGSQCSENGECASDQCHLHLCGECAEDSYCETFQFCNTERVSGTRCTAKRAIGYTCDRNEKCESAICAHGYCSACTGDDECSPNQYCELNGTAGNGCFAKKVISRACNSDTECRSGHCSNQKCGQCLNESECLPGQFCNTEHTSGSRCTAKRAIGYTCDRNEKCESAICARGYCSACTGDDQCSSDQYCELNGTTGNRCFAKKTVGTACGGDTECTSGHCSNQKCGQCSNDWECSPEQYCNTEHTSGSRCAAKKASGYGCDRNEKCESAICARGYCSECTGDDQCSSDQYCELNGTAGNRCFAKKTIGTLCGSDTECIYNHCSNQKCVQCLNDSECLPGKFCETEDSSGSGCAAKRAIGYTCDRNEKCESAICARGHCSECTGDDECSSDQYCELNDTKGNRCFAKKTIGTACGGDTECTSGRCSNQKCGQCFNNWECSPGQFCNTEHTSGSRCAAKRAIGYTCDRNEKCESAICARGYCSECTGDDECSSDQYCELNGTKGNRCFAKKTIGTACGGDTECTSGRCSNQKCGQCFNNWECSPGQFCNTEHTSGSRCTAKRAIGYTCDRNEKCESAICARGYCSECTGDDQCSSDQYCELNGAMGNRCFAKKTIDTTCGSDTECTSGHCSNQKCVQCLNNSECLPEQYCNTEHTSGSRCTAKRAIGYGCDCNEKCESAICARGYCSACTGDDECSSDQYCELNRATGNRCFAKKTIGTLCGSDTECIYNHCSNQKCVQCLNNSECSPGQFCNTERTSGSRCEGKRAIGNICDRNEKCESAICDRGYCSECTGDDQCSSDQYCELKGAMGNHCFAKKTFGTPCGGNTECIYNHCSNQKCVQCLSDSECLMGEICKLANPAADDYQLCASPAANGAMCFDDNECASDYCYNNLCGDCQKDRHCTSSQFCNFRTGHETSCDAVERDGAECYRGPMCENGHCTDGRCSQCTVDADCPASKYCGVLGSFSECLVLKEAGEVCSKDNECRNATCNNHRCGHCSGDFQCPSGEYCNYVVRTLYTGEPDPTFGCVQQSPTLGYPCARNEECLSQHCHNGLCADCVTDPDCSSGSYCDDTNVPAATCTPKFKFGKACSRNAQCSSGHCYRRHCVECTKNSHCLSSLYYCGVTSKMCQQRKCSGSCTHNRQCGDSKCQLFRCNC